MKNLCILISLIAPLMSMSVFAQAPRDVDITVVYVAPATGEQITNYDCAYSLKEDGATSASVDCDFNITNPLVPHVLSLIAATADTMDLHIAACNVVGCSTIVSTIGLVFPPAADPATPPVITSVTATKP